MISEMSIFLKIISLSHHIIWHNVSTTNTMMQGLIHSFDFMNCTSDATIDLSFVQAIDKNCLPLSRYSNVAQMARESGTEPVACLSTPSLTDSLDAFLRVRGRGWRPAHRGSGKINPTDISYQIVSLIIRSKWHVSRAGLQACYRWPKLVCFFLAPSSLPFLCWLSCWDPYLYKLFTGIFLVN